MRGNIAFAQGSPHHRHEGDEELWMRRIPGALALMALMAASMPAGAYTQTKFATEADAHAHCPLDTVVWVNLPTNIYYRKGDKLYGATAQGAYICEHDAQSAGDKAAPK